MQNNRNTQGFENLADINEIVVKNETTEEEAYSSSDSLSSIESLKSKCSVTSSFETSSLRSRKMVFKYEPHQSNKSRQLVLIDQNEDQDWSKDEEDNLTVLTEDDVEFLLANTGFDSEQIHRWHKDFLDKCATGCISKEQFKSFYVLLLPIDLNETSKEEILEKLFNLFDIDGDGRLSFSEFLVSFWIRCKAPTREKYTWIFNMFDTDRNGCLSYIELRNALTMCLDLNDLDELLEQLNKERINIANHLSKATASYESNNATSNDEDEEDYEQASDLDVDEMDCFSQATSSFTSCTQKSSCFYKNNKQYNLYSRTAVLVEDKLEETIFLLYAITQVDPLCQRDFYSHRDESKTHNNSTSSSLSNFSFSQLNKSASIDSLNSLHHSSSSNTKYKIQIEREAFLDLCERYKSLRKLLLPIKYFYDQTLID
jgi:Ca2+-binding EF-hand superfamily protein